ncbi:sulfite exporter TauE/SafE family protein [Pandoraea pulmonicola]|uniref:Probable membrane transporter protein n=2 Tax=Pandoraea pulmonicola TaxID=93221 RepID=A0AAJ4ZHH7_PANPU|nr:sulfite exporter TauE/SafE family protein [Pandoraea pulmonicola]SUA93400.1 Sulfite exporter TauE/SafE [Pandoraea pulmonicola]
MQEGWLVASLAAHAWGMAMVAVVGTAAGVVSGVVGTGSSMMLLPVLVYTYGPKQAVPIMAVAAIVGNVSKVLAWWREIDWRAVSAYSIAGAPAAALGARTLWSLPATAVDVALGLFFVTMVPVRHYLLRKQWRLSPWQLALSGAVIGFLTGIVLSTGPLSVPAFAAYGLSGGAFLGAESASSVLIYVAKVLMFSGLGALPAEAWANGLIVGATLMFGTLLGKRFVLGLSPRVFQRLLDVMLVVSGGVMLSAAWR